MVLLLPMPWIFLALVNIHHRCVFHKYFLNVDHPMSRKVLCLSIVPTQSPCLENVLSDEVWWLCPWQWKGLYPALEQWQDMWYLKPSAWNPPAYTGIQRKEGHLYPSQHLGIIYHRGAAHKTSHSGHLSPFQMRRIWFPVCWSWKLSMHWLISWEMWIWERKDFITQYSKVRACPSWVKCT